MFAVRLVQLIETHADKLSEGLMLKLKSCDRCGELLHRVPAEELKRRTHEIYRNLSEWVLTKTESEVEERYVGLGIRRCRQGVPFSSFLCAVLTTKQHLWEFLESEGLMEEPFELVGELDLLHSLERFFDRVLYFVALGYETAHPVESEHLHLVHAVGRR